jgi:hypothetical protein
LLLVLAQSSTSPPRDTDKQEASSTLVHISITTKN